MHTSHLGLSTQMANEQILGPGNLEFFTVLLPGFSEKLSLPHKFIRNINTKKCERAVLRSPLGNLWHVKVQGDSENLYFGEGWQEFARAHQLNVGFFLVFDYEGDMAFNVTVFDLSMCMKEYTPVNNSESNSKNHANDLISANVLKNMLQKSMKRNRRAVIAFENKHKMSEMNSFCASGPHFKATIKPSNLLWKPYLNLPYKFRTSSNISKKDKIILRDPKGQLWPIRIYYSSDNALCRRAQFGAGWEKFCINNNLEEGGTCIFKLVSKSSNDILHVSIFKKKCRKQWEPQARVGYSLPERLYLCIAKNI
ncbi:B3 domain-containing protein Os03g0212300 isoform X2 [Elaeis guineensis]|uniref:B3 domain-containing protein Os03g0212300 n=1 Tax=Elaeis guineensis var. tenera TaxID=51953 RepID=A0A6I9R365_ELAGV|nr:B3 domain-containing protein Os03g0212300 [Elaeis guineensis]